MKRSVLIFSPGCPWPPRSGFDRRVLSLLRGLRELDCTVTFLSTNAFTWKEPRDDYRALQGSLIDEYVLYRIPYLENWLRRAGHRLWETLGGTVPFDSPLFVLPRMRRWFQHQLTTRRPDAVLFFYANWHRLLRDPLPTQGGDGGKPRFWIDTIDLVTLNRQMWGAVRPLLPKHAAPERPLDPKVLSEDFYEQPALRPDPRELAVYERFDETIAISATEADIIARGTKRTQVHYLPMVEETHALENTYAGPALLTTGPNPFNLQAFYYFSRRVLPLIRQQEPGFSLDLTGAICDEVLDEPNVVRRGMVADLDTIFRHAGFLVCPVFGGTGQLVKVVEAMARGVAVIVLEGAAQRTPVVDQVNGLVVRDAAAFANAAVRLWQDRDLCRQLGERARECIARDYSPELLRSVLSGMLSRCGGFAPLPALSNEERSSSLRGSSALSGGMETEGDSLVK